MTTKEDEDDEAAMIAIAGEIDQVTDALSRVGELKELSNVGCAMALALASAAHVIHDGGDEDDFQSIIESAWRRALDIHGACAPGTKP